MLTPSQIEIIKTLREEPFSDFDFMEISLLSSDPDTTLQDLSPHLARFADLQYPLIFSILTQQIPLFKYILSFTSQPKLLLEQINSQGFAPLHYLADKPEFLLEIFKIYPKESERLSICQFKGFRNAVVNNIPTLGSNLAEAIRLLLNSLSEDTHKLELVVGKPGRNETWLHRENILSNPGTVQAIMTSFQDKSIIFQMLNTPDQNRNFILHKIVSSYANYGQSLSIILPYIPVNNLTTLILNLNQYEDSIISLALSEPNCMRDFIAALPNIQQRTTVLFKPAMRHSHVDTVDVPQILKAFDYPETLLEIFDLLAQDLEWVENNLWTHYPEIWLSMAKRLCSNKTDIRLQCSSMGEFLINQKNSLSAFCQASKCIKEIKEQKSEQDAKNCLFTAIKDLQNLIIHNPHPEIELKSWKMKYIKNQPSTFFDPKQILGVLYKKVHDSFNQDREEKIASRYNRTL